MGEPLGTVDDKAEEEVEEDEEGEDDGEEENTETAALRDATWALADENKGEGMDTSDVVIDVEIDEVGITSHMAPEAANEPAEARQSVHATTGS